MSSTLDRRTFLQVTAAAGGGLLVGGWFSSASGTLQAAGFFEPNVWIKVNADDTVRIMLTMLEMGQGVMTSMPMLVAEELDFDWTRIKTEWAGADPTFLSQLSSPDRERRLHDCRCRNRAPTAAQYRLFPRRC